MKTVIIAEKPNQGKLYAEAFEVAKREQTHIELKPCNIFPQGAVITWGIGHLVEIAVPGEHDEKWAKWNLEHLPIAPKQYNLKVADSKKAQFNTVKKLLKEADLIINGCDIDREGSNIFYLILKVAGISNKPIKRLWINSLEADEIRKGFQQLQSNDKDLLMHQEAHARQIADWTVGMNGSPLYSLLLQKQGLRETLSIGRCQSPLVMMIYDREQQIKNFVSKPFYELQGKFATSGQFEYTGKAKLRMDSREELNSFLLENQLSINVPLEGKITNVEKQEKSTKAPRLHSLSTLQAAANKKWKYSPKTVLDTVQNLYLAKVVTYPRTDCNFITEAEFAYLAQNVGQYQQLINASFNANITLNKRYVDNSKVQEHFAIVPTKTIPATSTLNGLSETERNIYEEILRTTLAMFHSDYKYEETVITTTVNGVEFYTKGKVELDLGWKTLFVKDSASEGTDKAGAEQIVLPAVSSNEAVGSVIFEKEGFTTPPKPFTEGQLIDLMKTAGKTLDIDEEDAAILKEVEGIGTEATRSNIIETVKQKGYICITKNIVSVTPKGEVLCKALDNALVGSPILTAKWESKLRLIGQGKLTLESFVADINQYILEMIQDAKKNITSNEDLNSSITSVQTKSEIGKCPKCSSGIVEKKGFYGCSNYPECKFTLSDNFRKKKLSKANIKNLLEGKETTIKGIKKADSSTYNAVIRLNGKGFIDFVSFAK
jgi:DNA topoisomerase III